MSTYWGELHVLVIENCDLRFICNLVLEIWNLNHFIPESESRAGSCPRGWITIVTLRNYVMDRMGLWML